MTSTETHDHNDLEFRCSKCHKLLGLHNVQSGECEVKCLRCGTVNKIFQNIQEQVIVTDSEGTILYVNELLEEITGYSVGEVIGKRPSLWGRQMPEEFYANLWKTIKDEKKSAAVIITNKRKDGTLYRALLKISPVFNTEGNVTLYMGMEKVLKPLDEQLDAV